MSRPHSRSTAPRAAAAWFASCALAALGAPAPAQATLPPPPGSTDAGGANVPALGMHAIKRAGGVLEPNVIPLPDGLVIDTDPLPVGSVFADPAVYVPDLAPLSGRQSDLNLALFLNEDEQYPLPFRHTNTDPSGTLDESAVDGAGAPVRFNAYWPPSAPEPFWLDDTGLDPTSPLEDLAEILSEMLATGDRARAQEALDILRGTNVSGALVGRAYRSFPLLHAHGPLVQNGFDEATRNVSVIQLWFGNLILSNAHLLRVPAQGDYTITWKLRGLGDPGAGRLRAFPIDEFAAMSLERGANELFWHRNSWIWKWFDMVEAGDGRRYALESLFAAHTGAPVDEFGQPVPSAAELLPGDERDWLFANRRCDLSGYVGQEGLSNESYWQTVDLDFDGRIGGFLVDGTLSAGGNFDAVSNAAAQFNQYGHNEAFSPVVDWSRGSYDEAAFAYDSSFTTLRKGQGVDVTVRYGQGAQREGFRIWGWRQQPARNLWLATYAEGWIRPDGRPHDVAWSEPWEQVAALGLDAIGTHSPARLLHDAFLAFGNSNGSPAAIAALAQATKGQLELLGERRGLPKVTGVAGFPNPAADLNLLYTNLSVYGGSTTIAPGQAKTWKPGDVLRVTIFNDDAVTRGLRVLDLGTTDYQFNGNDMGRLDWKPIHGAPQYVAGAWSRGYGVQSQELATWNGTDLAGIGNPFFVDPLFDDPAGFSPAGAHDLFHDYASLLGFSGPGFHASNLDAAVWFAPVLAGASPGAPELFAYLDGLPLAPGSVTTIEIVLPRAQALNNGALHFIDPRFPAHGGFTLHPRSVREIEALGE